MEHFVLPFSDCEPLLVALVGFKLDQDLVLLVFGQDLLVLDLNAVEPALLDEAVILVIPNLPLCSLLKLFEGFLFNHGGIGVHILSLQTDLL